MEKNVLLDVQEHLHSLCIYLAFTLLLEHESSATSEGKSHTEIYYQGAENSISNRTGHSLMHC